MMSKLQKIRKCYGMMLIVGMGGIACAALPAKSMASASAQYFQRIATFPVYRNLAENQSETDETVSEILAVSEDENYLIYTDGVQQRLGFVDIRDPGKPQPAGFVALKGEPTSVAVKGNYALVVVNTSVDYVNTSGELVVVDIADMDNPVISQVIDLGGQPDAISISPNGRYAVVAIENERDEEACPDGHGGLIDAAYGDKQACQAQGSELGALPQLPAGFLQVLELEGSPVHWRAERVELAGIGDVGAEDPEPEFVSVNRKNKVVVSLQENNHIVIANLKKRRVKRDFSAGYVDLSGIDIEKNKRIEPTGSLKSVPREPDAVSWVSRRFFVTANEGDYHGGSRGFSVFDRRGNIVFDSGNDIEYLAMRIGHYPEKRSGKKGTEPEGVAFARYDDGRQRFLFVGAERANLVAVYRVDRNGKPEYIQVLPTGVGPEGILPIPGKNLLAVAAEKDDASEGYRSMITIYHLENGPAMYPQIVSRGTPPIGWGALSGLAADPSDSDRLYAVHDSFYAHSKIYTIDVSEVPAVIDGEIPLQRNGGSVSYDLEGVTVASEGGFWAVSEGKPGVSRNLLLKISAEGNVKQEIELPLEVQKNQRKFGFEGVAESVGGRVFIAFQREWQDDPNGLVKIGEYDPSMGEWQFYYYPLDAAPEGAWVGLSEMVALQTGELAVIERDNQQGDKAAVKRIYRFDPAMARDLGEQYPVVTKVLLHDVLPDMRRYNGWVVDKLEGMAIAFDGTTYLVSDNDGLDDATGETMFLRLESLAE